MQENCIRIFSINRIRLAVIIPLAGLLIACGNSIDSEDKIAVDDFNEVDGDPNHNLDKGSQEKRLQNTARSFSCRDISGAIDYAPTLNLPSYPAFKDFKTELGKRGAIARDKETTLRESYLGIAIATLKENARTSIYENSRIGDSCNYDSYDDNFCEADGVTDVALNGNELTFKTKAPPTTFSHRVSDPEYSSGESSISGFAANETITTKWSRANDGTEYYQQKASHLDFSFVEHPDCSGSFKQKVFSNGSVIQTIEMNWTSPLKATGFKVKYTLCMPESGECFSN